MRTRKKYKIRHDRDGPDRTRHIPSGSLGLHCLSLGVRIVDDCGCCDMAESDGVFFYGAPGTLSTEAVDAVAIVAPTPKPSPAGKAPARSWAKIAKPAVEQTAPDVVVNAPVPLDEPAIASQPPPSAVQCSFFLAGGCYFGASCRFRHDSPPPAASVEWFSNRLARARCDAPPVAEESTIVAPDALPLDSFEEASARWQLSALGGAHAEASVVGDGSSAGCADEDGLFEAVATGVCPTAEAAEAALQAAERAASAEATCAICLERVLEVKGRRFGLLTGCPHAFCLPCIREWRARIDKPTATVRACPVCRTPSFFVIPSDRLLASARRKAQANEGYTSSQRTLPCRLFNQGRGTCAFGSSCWYAHLLPDGTPAVLPRPVYRIDAEGAPASVRGLRLNEFLG